MQQQISTAAVSSSASANISSLSGGLNQLQGATGVMGVMGRRLSLKSCSSDSSNNRFSQELDTEEKDKIEKWKDNLEHENHICPISHTLMVDPVVLADSGITYERSSIEKWLEKSRTCPISKKRLAGNVNQLIPNYSTKNLIEQAKEKYCNKLIGLLEQKLEDKKGIADCLALIDSDLLIYVDKNEKRTMWEKIMLIKLRMMVLKRDLEMSGNLDEWFNKLEYELLESTHLIIREDSSAIFSFDSHQFKSVKHMLDQLETKYDTTHALAYQQIKKHLDEENKKREEFEYRYRMKQFQKAKQKEERKVRREREAALQTANNAQSATEELSTTQWLAMGAGILGAGALIAVGLFSAFSSASGRNDRRK